MESWVDRMVEDALCGRPFTVDVEPPIFRAIENDDVRELDALVAGDPLAADAALESTGFSAVHLAADRGAVRCLRALILAGADVDASDVLGCTPLHNAASVGSATAVTMLLIGGADPTSTTRYGKDTPLHEAAAMGHFLVACVLLLAAPRVLRARDKHGRTPVGRALVRDNGRPLDLPGRAATVVMLLAAGAAPVLLAAALVLVALGGQA